MSPAEIQVIRKCIARVELIRTMSPEAKLAKTDISRATQAAYYAGWDDCCAVIDKLLRKMTEVR